MSQIFNQKNQKAFRQNLKNNMTSPEIKLWSLLKNSQIGYKFRRQHGIGRYIVDFYCPDKKLAVEVDGDSHFNEISKESDKARDRFLISLGIKILRFNNQEVMKNIEGVVDKIIEIINQPPLAPPLKGGKNLS